MDRLKALESFVAAATRGSLTAAARDEGVAPAIIGRRLDALEARLGTRLLVRTTRRLSLTDEGHAFLGQCQRLLLELADAEAGVAAGGNQAGGHLRLTAPAGFGRRHVAPQVPRFHQLHPQIRISLDLSDRVIDLAAEGLDCAVRVGDLPDSSLVSVRLAENRRVCVATPRYLQRHGTPQHPNELARFDCLALSGSAAQSRGWLFRLPRATGGEAEDKAADGDAGDDSELIHLRPGGALACTDGQVLHEWCLADGGIAWRSLWEVGADIAAGRLVEVLADFAAPPNGVYAVFPERRHLPQRVRLWIDFLKHCYGQPGYWQNGQNG